MNCWNYCNTARKIKVEYAIQNVTISYDKIKQDIFEM